MAAVDTQAVDRVAQVTQQRLNAVNQISSALQENYSAYQGAKLRADRAEAMTRARIYEGKVKELYAEKMKKWNALPLDHPVPDFTEEFNADRDALRQEYLGSTPDDVSRYMGDKLDLVDGEYGLQARSFATEQFNARAVHMTMVETNAASNDIFDEANDPFYESTVQTGLALQKANLPDVDAQIRAKMERDLLNDYTVSFVRGLIVNEQFKEAKKFLETDPRANERLYDKDKIQLLSQLETASAASIAQSKVTINDMFDEFKSDMANAGESDYTDELIGRLSIFAQQADSPSEIEWAQKMRKDIKSWGDIGALQKNTVHLSGMSSEDLMSLRGNLEDNSKQVSASKADREYATAKVAAIDKHLEARQRDPTAYIRDNSARAWAMNHDFVETVVGVVGGEVPPAVAGLKYSLMKDYYRAEAAARGMDPLNLASPLPKDSEVGQMIQDWLDEATGPDLMYARGQTVRQI